MTIWIFDKHKCNAQATKWTNFVCFFVSQSMLIEEFWESQSKTDSMLWFEIQWLHLVIVTGFVDCISQINFIDYHLNENINPNNTAVPFITIFRLKICFIETIYMIHLRFYWCTLKSNLYFCFVFTVNHLSSCRFCFVGDLFWSAWNQWQSCDIPAQMEN